MEIYTFDKSLQERLLELEEILSGRGTVVPASRIKHEWTFHVELVIEPVGWQALWKIPRLTCQEFEIHYPTIVVVQVENVDFADLSALVKIVAVQDEIHLPEKCDVPLIELYPTRNQENAVIDAEGTANCVDQLRFFFNHLWMPWDTDDDETADWVTSHLETRVRLFFDMKRGEVNKDTCDIIRTLIREGKEISAKILRLEEDISDDEGETRCLVDEDKACQLVKLHFRLQQIKTEMDVLENPAMREMLQRNPHSGINSGEVKRRESRGRKVEAFFVWHGGELGETMGSLEKAKKFLPQDVFIKTTGCMQEALHSSETGDIVVLGEGEHLISGAGGLEEGGRIVGIGDRKSTVVCAKESTSGPSLLDFSGEVILQNLTLDLGELQAGILVRKCTVKIIDCRIVASNQSVVKLGIVVLPEGKLILQNSTFVGLGTAVVIHNAGQCQMENCDFEDCIEGLQVQDGVKFHAVRCKFSNFKEYAIRMETDRHIAGVESKTGSIELLKDVGEVALEECIFANNLKGDVAIRPRLSVALSAKHDNAMEIVP
ncbi:protein nessun dorma [Diachasmimorpha longicaudata]|uniref:protein nessun dorma n=1 Tax=Diachasmimorpha longicaudata TaxID=58733 RepID=UPI0030B8F372